MVAGNMKIITLTNVSTVKNQHLSNNMVKTSSPNSINKANVSQQTPGINTNESPKMRYFNATNIYNHNDSAKSLQTPKQCNSNNKNGKKSQSHMFYNIPTTSVLNRKKYYQQHHRHNQHQHNFVNNNKEIRNNIAIKNHNLLESDLSNTIDAHLACVQKLNIPKIDNSKVEDFVNNNTTTLNVNNICIPQVPDDNYNGTTVDNSIALSSHRAKSEFKQHAPSTDSFPVSTPADKHNCVGENKSINLDCNSCWTNLVAPQCTESPALLSWPWVHISRRKSSSISSTSSYSSSVSSALSISAESNPELQQNISVTYASNSHTSKKKPFRKGIINNNNRGIIDTRYSSSRVKGQRQRRTTNVSTTTDDLQSKVPLIPESQRNIHPAEDPTAMSTALATNTVSATATTTSIVDSKVETTIAAENTSGLVKSPSNVVTLTVTSPSSSSPKEISNIDEFANLSVQIASPQPSGESTNSSVTLTTPSGSPTVSTPGSSPSNSYSLDFLHSVGIQMTGGANLSALCKNNTHNNRIITPYNSQNTGVMSPVRTAYSYQNILPHRPHPMHGRYTSNSGGGIGVGSSSNHMRDQRTHRFQHSHHHHHPQQLTIASFMQKELLNENVLAGGNRCDISDNGPEDSDGVDVNNNNGDYTNQHSYRNHQRCHNYYQSHYQQSQQHRLSGMQHGYVALHPSYNREAENEGGSRVTRSGGNAYSQNLKRNNMYQNHQSNGEVTSNSVQSLPVHKHSVVEEIDGGNVNASNNAKGNNENNNLWSSKQFHQKILSSKKSNSGANVSYSCSSSSSTTSSVSSNSSQASTSSYRQQKVKSSTQMNLIIETLPRKVNASTHRGNHRLQQVNYHNQQFTSAAGGSQSLTTQQTHQNIRNLTYVNTEGLTASVGIGPTVPSRSCSPSLPPPVASTSGGQSQDAISSVVLSYTPNHFQSQQQHQQNFICGKRLTTPFALNVPSSHVHSTSPHTVGNMICYAQLNDSVTSSDSNQAPCAVQGAKSRDYDDSDSSSTNSAVQSQRRNKYQQAKSVSLSSSSSTSSTSSSTTRNFNGPTPALSIVAMPHLQSPEPTEFGYNPTFSATSQHYTPQTQPLTSPQQQSPFRSNGVISMLNVPFTNNYPDDDLNTMKQHSLKHQGIHHQQRHFYFTTGEHLNTTPLPAHVANAGYWSPLQHSSFIYPQPANFLATAPCVTPTATLSPGFSEQDDHHFHHPHNQQQLNLVNQTEGLPPAGQTKRSSTPQMGGAVISQQPHQRLAQSTVSQGGMVTTATNVAALRQRNGGRSSQQQTLHHHQQMTAPPPTAISHVYPQHNLLFSGSTTTHIRSSSNTSHDFFTHTPPDRFLARAHLIEAKEAPSSLLNNSKWDNLSQGVWNKFINSQQTEETFKQKMRLWRYLYIIIKNTYPRFGLYLVGSTISGFGADTSDVDMCLVSRSTSNVEPRMEALFNLTVLRDYLSKSAEFENFNLIEAKVPILRFRDRIHQLEVDLNFNNCVGIKNTHLLYCYSQLDWRLRPMVLVTKLWAQYHNINNAKNMTISSYSLVLMVIHFLQYAVSPAVLPCLHDLFPDKFPLLRSNDFGYVDMNETIGPYESKNTQTIGELFLYFLEYYSCFDYTQFAISIRTGGLLPINVCRLAKSSKNDIHQWKELCIEEPFDLTNTARSVYDFETFERVKAVFVASWRILQQTLDLNSIFAPIIISSTNTIVSTLRHTGYQYDDCHNSAPSDISTADSNTTNINTNGSTILLGSDNSSNLSPALSLASLPIETNNNNHITKEIFNTANGNSKSAEGSLTELVS